MQAPTPRPPRRLLDLLDKVLAVIGKSEQVREFLPDFDKLKPLLTPKVVGDRLTLTLDDAALTAVLRQLIPKAAQASDRVRSENNLKQLALAALNYQDAFRKFPANATHDKKGNALLSWRVQLLPYLGEEKLYKEFHLDEPWDGEHNKKLIARMPAVFRSPTSPKLAADGKTTYLAPVGDATMFPDGRGVRIAEVTDGTSNTILFVDAADDSAVVVDEAGRPGLRPEGADERPRLPLSGALWWFSRTGQRPPHPEDGREGDAPCAVHAQRRRGRENPVMKIGDGNGPGAVKAFPARFMPQVPDGINLFFLAANRSSQRRTPLNSTTVRWPSSTHS